MAKLLIIFALAILSWKACEALRLGRQQSFDLDFGAESDEFEEPIGNNNIGIDECIHTCPKTSEYNPVCGSDGKKYFNIGQLRCARLCGVDVDAISRRPPCPAQILSK